MRDGSGNYNLPAGNPVVTGTVISSTQFNSTMTDVATAMTQSISKDGQTTPTNNLPMGGNKHTGVADGNLANQYASIGQTQNGSLNKATSVANVVDAFTAALTPAIASYTDGQVVTLIPSVTNTTTTVTLALNGLAAKPVNKEGGVACVAGDIILNVPIYLVYYATGGYFLLLNPQRITSSRFNPLVLAAAPGVSPLGITATTTNFAIAQFAGNAATLGTNDMFVGQLGDSSAALMNRANAAMALGTNSTTRVTIGAAGGVAITSPSSGPALNVSGLANTQTAQIIGSATTGQSFGLYVAAGTNASDLSMQVFNQPQTHRYGYIAGDGGFGFGWNGTTNAITGIAAGNISIPAPTSGTAISIQGVAGGNSALINSGGGAGTSLGVLLRGGSNSSDYALFVQDATAAHNYFQIRGDGVVLGNDGTNLLELGYKDTPLNTPGGSYTLTASDRGKTIVVANGATITVPNAIFSGGAVVSFMIASGSTATIAQGASFTLGWAGNGATTGSRTITGAGLATVAFSSASAGLISGAGLT